MRKMVMRTLATLVAVVGVAFIFAASEAAAQQAAPAAAPANPGGETGARKFTEVSVLIGKTKFWLPSTIVVDQGDQVEINLKNEVPGTENNQHGFTIPAYNITTVVTAGKPEKVTFTADKPGVFAFGCQLHPAHVGGQLIVRPKGS